MLKKYRKLDLSVSLLDFFENRNENLMNTLPFEKLLETQEDLGEYLVAAICRRVVSLWRVKFDGDDIAEEIDGYHKDEENFILVIDLSIFHNLSKESINIEMTAR